MTFNTAAATLAAALLSTSLAIADPASPPSAKTPDVPSPDVATLLFSNPQWSQAPVGTSITYAYAKTSADTKTFGESFDDVAKIKLDKGDAPDERVVELRLFTGTHTRPSGPTRSDPQNPMLIFALELNLENLDKAFGIPNPRYLRNAVRKAWREAPKIEPVDLDIGGKKVKGTRITVIPFVNDPQKDRMHGLEGMVYQVDISDSVPGQIVDIDIHAPATGTPIYSETLRYQSESKP